MIIAALLLQATAPQPAAATPPDIQLGIDLTARRVAVENKGELDLTARASVNGRESEGNVVEVDSPDLPQGRARASNVRVRVRAETRIADPLAPLLNLPIPQEPQSPE
ncbi:MAG: hypothetical protein JWL74_1847 [Alphaproteobacteria bacterium]|nr:hypothetical protein [Alphaproteobacteria bacterium]